MSLTVLLPFQKEDAYILLMHLSDHYIVKGW